MATGLGTVVIDFGAEPGSNEASIAVTGQTTISATSKAEAFMMSDDTTADHTAGDHRWLNAKSGRTCGTPTAGVGFTITICAIEKMSGTYKIRWVWAD